MNKNYAAVDAHPSGEQNIGHTFAKAGFTNYPTPPVVAAAEALLRRALRLEHGANVFPLAHIALYYVFLGMLVFPGLVANTWLRILCWGCLTLLNFSLTVGIMHMHCHRHLFTVRWANRLVEILMCLPSLLTATEMILYHVYAHHKHENGQADPSSTIGSERGLRSLVYWFTYPSRCKIYTLRNVYGQRALSRWQRHQGRMAIDLGLCVSALVLLAWLDLNNVLLIWFPSLVLSHLNTGYFAWLTHAPVMYPGSPTNSLATVNNWMGLLVHNQGYHHVHHRFPGIHWTEIPERLDLMLSVEPKQIVPYWVILQSAWRITAPGHFFDKKFGHQWHQRYMVRKTAERIRLRLLPYFAWI